MTLLCSLLSVASWPRFRLNYSVGFGSTRRDSLQSHVGRRPVTTDRMVRAVATIRTVSFEVLGQKWLIAMAWRASATLFPSLSPAEQDVIRYASIKNGCIAVQLHISIQQFASRLSFVP